MADVDKDERLDLARWLHENYEEIAAAEGWETQEGTSVDFGDLPRENRNVMLRLAGRMLGTDQIEVFRRAVERHTPDDTVEMVLYGTDDPEGACVQVFPFWPHDVPQSGDAIELSDGRWIVQRRAFHPKGDRPVEVYARPPPGARGKS